MEVKQRVVHAPPPPSPSPLLLYCLFNINLSFFSNSDNEEASGTVKKKTLQKFIFSATLTLPKSFKRKGKEKKITKGEALGTVYVKISQCVSSAGRAPDCRAGGRGLKPRPDQHSGSLNN